MTAAVRGPRLRRGAAVLPLLALALAGLTACGAPVDEGPKATLPGADTTLSTTPSFYGNVVTDGAGRVLYQFSADRGGESTCYGPCAQTWQPYIATGEPHPAYPNLNPLEDSQIDLVARQDGRRQVRYQGKPLYFFSGDTAPADVKGAGLSQFGGQWYATSNSGQRVLP